MNPPQRLGRLGNLLNAANARTCDNIDDDPEPIGVIQCKGDSRLRVLDAYGFIVEDGPTDTTTDTRFAEIAAAYIDVEPLEVTDTEVTE